MKWLFLSILFVLLCAQISFSQQQPKISRGLQIQILLDRAGFSPGEIDGRPGMNVKKALSAFQEAHDLRVTGRPDAATLQALGSSDDLTTTYTITDQDTGEPFIDQLPQDPMEQAKLDHLGYTNVLEELGEKFHCSPNVLKQLNPQAQFTSGESIEVPSVGDGATQTQSADQTQTGPTEDATIHVNEKTQELILKTSDGKILFYAPTTAGSEHDPLPIGEWKITLIKRNPQFNYNPELFWDAKPEDTKVKIQPGPNNPVGVVWMGTNAPHYGLHGTPEPGKIGHSESHGCVRMTNWDALRLAGMIRVGTPVIFE
jgi:lipoprotein-anchoring transpeptidase ErfK/SrfK